MPEPQTILLLFFLSYSNAILLLSLTIFSGFYYSFFRLFLKCHREEKCSSLCDNLVLLSSPPFLDHLGDSIDGAASQCGDSDQKSKSCCHSSSYESANGSECICDGTCGSRTSSECNNSCSLCHCCSGCSAEPCCGATIFVFCVSHSHYCLGLLSLTIFSGFYYSFFVIF